MPSEQEFGELKKRAVHYIAGLLVHEYKNLQQLRQFVPARTPIHPPSKSEFVPMEVLFKDEKYVAETVEILSSLMKDADLHGENEAPWCKTLGEVPHGYKFMRMTIVRHVLCNIAEDLIRQINMQCINSSHHDMLLLGFRMLSYIS